MRNILLLLIGILLLPLSVLAGGPPASIEDVQLIQTEEAATQLSAYYDLRDRKSYIQVTNVTSSTVGIHIQIFQHDRGCTELNFDDELTGNDTVVYDLDDVIKNNGSQAPISLADNSYGYVVVSDRVLDQSPPPEFFIPTLIGNFRIVDDANYEYRTNMVGVTPGNPILSDLGEITFQAHFNTVDNAIYADLVGYVYDGANSSTVRNFAPGINFDVFVYDFDEEPLSCDRRNFACGTVMNYGINEDYPNSRTEDVVCPGGGLAGLETAKALPNGLNGGFVDFVNGALGELPSSPVDNVFVYLIGINNGDGTGSMDTWIDPTDTCGSDPEKEDPGECGCGVPDTDTDSDGTPDCNEECPDDPDKREAGECGCGTPDTDSDNDQTPDCNDNCPDDPNKTEEGRCGCGFDDDAVDPDGDGFCGEADGCPNDPDKSLPGECGCGVPDTDTDSDGTADCNDNCPDDPNKTEPGICNCGVADVDTDSDETLDCEDGCPNDINKIDPGICGCGTPDDDTDTDGTPDCNDGCPTDSTKIDPGECGCNVPDTDSDSDGTADCNDICQGDDNTGDSDGDGVCDDLDQCLGDDNIGESDGDGVCDDLDQCPFDSNKTDPGDCGCGIPDTDSDIDGTPDCNDECPNDPDKVVEGECGCGVPEGCNVCEDTGGPCTEDEDCCNFNCDGVNCIDD